MTTGSKSRGLPIFMNGLQVGTWQVTRQLETFTYSDEWILRGEARRGPYHYLLDKIHYRYWLAQSQQAGLRADVARQLIAEVIEMTGFVINQVRSSITGPFPMDVAESIFTGMEMQVKKLAAQIES